MWCSASSAIFILGLSSQLIQGRSQSSSLLKATPAQRLSPGSTCGGVFFASFNIQNFGPTKASRSAVLNALAVIVARYDIVAIQELSQSPQDTGPCGPNTAEAICALLGAVNKVAKSRYSVQVSPRIGDEQYVLMFNAKVSYVQGAVYPDDKRIHSRPPYAFEVRIGKATLAIATTHTGPSTALSQINDYVAVSKWMESAFHADTYIIAGDFNADGSYFDEETAWDPILAHMPGYLLLTGNDLDTTVAHSSNTYDRILATETLKSDPAAVFNIEGHVNLSDVLIQGCRESYIPTSICQSVVWSKVAQELSDHYPVELCMHPCIDRPGCKQNETSRNTLLPGDCAIVGFKADNPDDVAIVLLKDVPSGQKIFVTISSAGDQVIVFAGSVERPTYLCAINFEGSAAAWQSTADSSKASALPTGLVNGQTALALSQTANAAYTGSATGSASQLRAAINDATHWIVHDSKPPKMPSLFR
eukprot:TRINITY_DN3324_c0_g1_i2.p1 TRINITY_DN3324_c0_g1~~TRINITY_DN3324_c0_g1_i2.p1  ORF type:complete len:483 (-),score=66.49 TRINITY_DN3324_c0_g1_i2:835-2259(-)